MLQKRCIRPFSIPAKKSFSTLAKNSVHSLFLRIFHPHLSQTVLPVIVPFSLGDKPAHMDQFLSINCAVSDGDLPLNIFWTFNNQPITPDMDVSINRLGKRTSVLTIDSVNAHHAGNYSCHGQNSAGSTSFTSELKVIGVFSKGKNPPNFLKFGCISI